MALALKTLGFMFQMVRELWSLSCRSLCAWSFLDAAVGGIREIAWRSRPCQKTWRQTPPVCTQMMDPCVSPPARVCMKITCFGSRTTSGGGPWLRRCRPHLPRPQGAMRMYWKTWAWRRTVSFCPTRPSISLRERGQRASNDLLSQVGG